MSNNELVLTKNNITSFFLYKIFDPQRILNCIFIIFLTPIACITLTFFYLLYKIFNRGQGSFIYKGERMGKGMKTFQIYKIRTLATKAESDFANKILSPDSNLELTFGRFLRETRLDELPQLLNILKGDMNILGPRPIRKTIYEKNCKKIKNYGCRFVVKPGLLGLSQILTPHSAPKRIRAVIDQNFVLKIRENPLQMFFFVGLASCALIHNLVREFKNTLIESWKIYTHHGFQKNMRLTRRIKPQGAYVLLPQNIENDPARMILTTDLNHNALKIYTNSPISSPKKFDFFLISEPIKKNKKRKQAKCHATILRESTCTQKHDRLWCYVISYTPASQLNRFIVDHYILKKNISNFLIS